MPKATYSSRRADKERSTMKRAALVMCCFGFFFLHMAGCATAVGSEDSTELDTEIIPSLEPAATGYCGYFVRNVGCRRVGSGPFQGSCGSSTWKYWNCTRHEFTAG